MRLGRAGILLRQCRWTVLLLLGCTNGDVSIAGDSLATDTAAALAMVDNGAPVLLPRDEANESFRTFRSHALRALAQRDSAFLYGMLAPEIKNSFGGDDGVEGFRRIWKLDTPGTDVFTALMRVLTMGGQQLSDSQFVAPYVYAFWPDSLDAFGHVAVTGDSVRVLEAPLANARVLGGASNSILKLKEWKSMPESGVAADTTWAQVQLPGGSTGWIRGAGVYSPVGWRAFFVRRDNRWRMIFFVAGD